MRLDSTQAGIAGNQEKVFELLAASIQEHLTLPMDADKVREICDEKIAEARLPRPLAVTLENGTVNVIDSPHGQLAELLSIIEEGHKNLMLVGPAGSGKTTLARQVAEALGLEFGFISLSAGVTESHLLGRTLPEADGSWKFKAGKFVEIYEKGGVFLLDEVDAADPNVMVAINAALANGMLVTTDGVIHHRSDRCYIMAAANTWGTGGDSLYVGRNQLDAATLDRFVLSTLFVDYDVDLEKRIAGVLPEDKACELLGWVNDLRQAIKRNRLRRVASTRLVGNAVKALAAGRTLEVVKARFLQSWSKDEVAKLN